MLALREVRRLLSFFTSLGGPARRVGLFLVATALLAAPAAARATTITVHSTADSLAGCTLRNAITAANTNSVRGTCPAGQPSPAVDTIDFAVPSGSTITLASVLPVVSDDVDIAGPGKSQLAVSGADTFQLLNVDLDTSVSLSGITLTHGLCDSSCGSQGGAILNQGSLTLRAIRVTASTATVTTSGAVNAFPEGGAIQNDGGATIHLVLTTISGNTATASGATNQNGPGGGGLMNRGTMTIDRSTVSMNSAVASGGTFTNAQGGGIYNRGSLTVRRSTVSGNTATASGASSANGAAAGGIGNANDPALSLTIRRSTVSDNAATSPGGSQAGGIGTSGGTLAITSSTIAHNTATSASNLIGFSNLHVKNTIVSNPGGPDNCTQSGNATSEGFNLSDQGTCGFTDPTDRPNTDPMLAPSLAFNGGPTKTYALLPGSPAIDQGLSSLGETVDQRGKKRPSDFGNIANATGGDGSDIGAFEFQDVTPPNTVIDSGPAGAIHDPTPTFTFHSTEAGSTFQCKVDAHSFAACTSPRTLAHLVDGSHTFRVRAKDLAGNTDPSPASRSFNLTTAEVKRSGSTLVVTAAPGAKDNFKVTKPTATTIRVSNLPAGSFTASGVHVGPGCTRSGDYTANCSASSITTVNVSSGTATDRVLSMSPLPMTINGGAGSDGLIGGPRADTITGGPGADILQGNNGNDTLRARDLTSDTAINCDGGSTPGAADKADLDLLPKDSSVSGCETITRH